MMVWLMVINPAWLAPMITAAAMANLGLPEKAISAGPMPLDTPNTRNSSPRDEARRMPASRMEVAKAPAPTPPSR